MRIRRGLLFWGLFLIPLGGMSLLVRSGVISAETVANAWRLWPLVLIVLGAMIVVGRTRAALLGTALGALILGTAAGGAIAGGTFWLPAVGDCGPGGALTDRGDGRGTFAEPATVRLDMHCGSVDLGTASGSEWTWQAAYNGDPPIATAAADRLTLRAPDGGPERRQDWTVEVPAGLLHEVDLSTNAGGSTLDLSGATLSRVAADVNAGDLLVDAGQASVEQLNVSMNAGRMRITLGESGSVSGSLSVNAGAIELCVAPGAELRFRVNEQLTFVHNLSNRGFGRDGQVWSLAGTSGQRVDLTVEGNAASFTLNPEGGCK
ncbi:MAG TPA: DUF5668 domain-containing protein [Candidatus Limnocylindrales bacterium]|nr:DUF5668 domain-containing protein [Candidatus Limnocylindrales bacterium]